MEKEEFYKKLLQNLDPPKFKSENEVWERLQKRMHSTSSSDDAEALDKVLSGLEVPGLQDEEKSWQEVAAKTIDREAKVVRMVPSWLKYAAAAAVVGVAIVVASLFSSNSLETIATNFGEKTNYTLPDGSAVMLNGKSTISCDVDNWDTKRLVTLEGEGFFDVAKGSKFTVRTAKGDVSVLGTSFNVYNRGGELDVECYTGKVKVADAESGVILTPGERGESGSKMSKEPFDLSKTSWRDDNYKFLGSELERFFTEFEVQFGKKIIFEGDKERFETSEVEFEKSSLDNALKAFCLPFELNYSIEEENVIISEKK